jgi:hypothetical protein
MPERPVCRGSGVEGVRAARRRPAPGQAIPCPFCGRVFEVQRFGGRTPGLPVPRVTGAWETDPSDPTVLSAPRTLKNRGEVVLVRGGDKGQPCPRCGTRLITEVHPSRSWSRWREQIVQELRQQDSVMAVLADSLASARVQLALARADGLACTARQRQGRAR